jgi:hypothetical protein
MKKLIAIAALATAAVATPAFAGSLTGEIRLSDVNGSANSTEYRAEYWNNLGALKLGAEFQTKQGENAGALGSKVSVKAGPALPSVAGLQLAAYGEVGKNLAAGHNFEFWGAAVKASKELVGPLSLNVGYRHREGFAAGDINEERLHAGLGYAVTDKLALGATYYRTRGTGEADAIGLGVTHKF